MAGKSAKFEAYCDRRMRRAVQKKGTQPMSRPSQQGEKMNSHNPGCGEYHFDQATRRRNAGKPEEIALLRITAIQMVLQISYQVRLGSLGELRRSVNVAKKGFDAFRIKNAIDPCTKLTDARIHDFHFGVLRQWAKPALKKLDKANGFAARFASGLAFCNECFS